jgi:transposase
MKTAQPMFTIICSKQWKLPDLCLQSYVQNNENCSTYVYNHMFKTMKTARPMVTIICSKQWKLPDLCLQSYVQNNENCSTYVYNHMF